MTKGKFFKRLYLWNLAAAFFAYLMKVMIKADWMFTRMHFDRKDAIVEKAGLFCTLFLVFAAIHFFYKMIRKRMKRALTNLHFFITLNTYILFVVVYSKLDVFDEQKITNTNNMAYINVIETDTLLNILWGMFYVAQVIFVIAMIHAFYRKKNTSHKTEEFKSETKFSNS